MNNKIIQLDHIHRTVSLVRECQITRAIGVVIGLNGVGKTSTLRYVERKYASFGLEGVCVYHRCSQTYGSTRGVKDLLVGLGRKDLAFRAGVSLPLLIRQAEALFKKRDIKALFLDEADTWSRETLNGVIALQDVCSENRHSFALIVAGVRPVDLWIGGAGFSRTLRIECFTNLSFEHTIAVLKKWDGAFEEFAKKVASGDEESLHLAKVIHKNTSGNLRRMRFFAEVFLMHHQTVDADSVAKTFEKVMYEKL